MDLASLAFAVLLWAGFGVPFDLGVETREAAIIEGVDPYDLAALLISEHRGAYPDDKTSATGAHGVWQLSPGWVDAWHDHHGVERTRTRKEDLEDSAVRSRVAAYVVAYSVERHRSCLGEHHWVAHWKCGPGGRDECRAPVRRWLSIRSTLPESTQ